MQARLEKLKSQRFMLFSLVFTGLAIMISEYIGKETAIVFTNWIFVPIPGAMLVLSIILAKKHGITGDHGKAWIAFAVFAACWFIAEQDGWWKSFSIIKSHFRRRQTFSIF